MIIIVLLSAAVLFAAGWIMSSIMRIGKSEGNLYLNQDYTTGRKYYTVDIDVWKLNEGDEVTLRIKKNAVSPEVSQYYDKMV